MSSFETIRVDLINAKERVDQLLIDGVKQLDVFEDKLIGTTYLSEYKTILKYIEHAANGNLLPKKKMRRLEGNADGITEFEFKSEHLRVYVIQQPSKKLVIFLGFKNSQDADIVSFRSLKKRFIDFIKSKENDKRRFDKKP
ncbi:MAG TPA: hypothetical protein VNS58_06365 [Puia sp.]|nr:hypothetical protein [Puia sp.]